MQPISTNDYSGQDENSCSPLDEVCITANNHNSTETMLSSIVSAKIGILDFSILMVMWFLIFAASIKNLGRLPGVLFLGMNIFLVLHKPGNGILVLLLLLFSPVEILLIPRFFVTCSAIAAFGYVIHGLFVKFQTSFFNIFILTVTIFVAYTGLTIFISPDRAVGLNYFTRYFEGLLAAILLFGLVSTRQELGRVLKWWAIVTALALLVCIGHYIKGPTTPLFSLTAMELEYKTRIETGGLAYNRLLWPGLEPNYFCAYLIFGFGLSLAFLSAAKFLQRFFWLVVTAMIGINIVGSFSRSGFLAALFVLGLFLAKRNIKGIVFIGILAGLGVFLLPLIPGLSERIFGIGEAIQTGGSGRFELWGQAIRAWIEAPLFGKGIGSFFVKFNNAAHNTFLQVLAEEGLIGISLYCIIILIAIKHCHNVKNYYSNPKHPDAVFSQILIIALVGMCMMMGTITFQDVKLFWMECGVCSLIYLLTARECNQS